MSDETAGSTPPSNVIRSAASGGTASIGVCTRRHSAASSAEFGSIVSGRGSTWRDRCSRAPSEVAISAAELVDLGAVERRPVGEQRPGQPLVGAFGCFDLTYDRRHRAVVPIRNIFVHNGFGFAKGADTVQQFRPTSAARPRGWVVSASIFCCSLASSNDGLTLGDLRDAAIQLVRTTAGEVGDGDAELLQLGRQLVAQDSQSL